MNDLTKVISDALKANQQSGSDYIAEVTRVEGQTAYVRIAGSDIADTPVAMSISAKVGDTVRVRVADGKAWITGNDTDPPASTTEVSKTVEDSNNYLYQKISNNLGDYSSIKQTVDGLETTVSNVAGQVSTINQSVSGISTRVTNAEGDISTITLDVDSIELSVGNKMAKDMSNKASSITIGSGTMTFNSNTLVVNSSKFKLDSSGNATFSGALSAATGSFTGSVVVDKTNYKVILGSNDSIPFRVSSGSYMVTVQPTFVSVAYGSRVTSIYIDTITCTNGSLTASIEPGLIKDGYGQCIHSSSNNIADLIITANGGSPYMQVAGSGVAYGVTIWSSDEKLKENIEDSEVNATDIINSIRHRTFDWKESGYHNNNGYIAQELQEVLPDAVFAVGEGDQETLQIDAHIIIPYLTKALQEQNERITLLEKRLEALEDKLNG